MRSSLILSARHLGGSFLRNLQSCDVIKARAKGEGQKYRKRPLSELLFNDCPRFTMPQMALTVSAANINKAI